MSGQRLKLCGGTFLTLIVNLVKKPRIPVSTEEYGLSVAARPSNSRLDKSKLEEQGFTPLPTWQDAVSRYLKEAEL